MAMNIKCGRVEELVDEIVKITGETKTEAIRVALSERRERLAFRTEGLDRSARALKFLEREVWPAVPADQRGKRLTRKQIEAILGYGREGA